MTTTRPARDERRRVGARRSPRPGSRPGRLTGERPRRGATPDSLLALHDAGYRAVLDRLGPGRVLDVGCGEGFESLRLAGDGRQVVGVDYDAEATVAAWRLGHGGGSPPDGSGPPDGADISFSVARMDALGLGLASASFDAVCSSHLIEHFADPSGHVAELARVTADGGVVYFLTPNAPADFENPFHLRLFGPGDLASFLGRFFEDVWVGGVDASERVKEEFAARRAKAARVLRLDVLDLRHRMPRRWYVTLYSRLLPLAYALVERGGHSGRRERSGHCDHAERRGADAADWFVTDRVDETTLVLFAVCGRPRRSS